jgi:hypothetical protein
MSTFWILFLSYLVVSGIALIFGMSLGKAAKVGDEMMHRAEGKRDA